MVSNQQALIKTTRKDWDEIAKQTNDFGASVNRWEQFLTGTQTAFQQQAEAVEDVYSYDISQAYANYKKQQLQLQMNERLGAGFQQQVGEQLQTEYGTAYQDIKTQEASDIANLNAQHQKTVQSAQEEFSKWGETARQLQEVAYEWGQTNIGELDRPLYDVSSNATGESEYTLSGYGKDYFAKILTDKKFEDYLYEENRDLYEAYVSDIDAYNQAIAGVELRDRTYTDKYYREAETKYRTAASEAIKSKSTNLDKIQELHGSNYADLTTVEMEQIAGKLTQNPDYIDTVKDPKNNKKGYSSVSVYGGDYQWTVVGAADIELTKSYHLLEKMYRGEVSYGDVLHIGNNYYQVSKHGALPKLVPVTSGKFGEAGTVKRLI